MSFRPIPKLKIFYSNNPYQIWLADLRAEIRRQVEAGAPASSFLPVDQMVKRQILASYDAEECSFCRPALFSDIDLDDFTGLDFLRTRLKWLQKEALRAQGHVRSTSPLREAFEALELWAQECQEEVLEAAEIALRAEIEDF
ncbi:hypothetical protein FAI40_03430 [Acetobacteraceae bacterium]|nr:hypothetical protein FAI40_03430 [Acetobacteraceae bacterium]